MNNSYYKHVKYNFFKLFKSCLHLLLKNERLIQIKINKLNQINLRNSNKLF